MSTLNEIAANHARMAKEMAEKSTDLTERHLQIVGGFEVPAADEQPHMPLHFIAVVQDAHLVQTTGYLS